VHIARSKEKEKDKWDHGNAVIADLATSLQPFKHDVYDLEVRLAAAEVVVHISSTACTASTATEEHLLTMLSHCRQKAFYHLADCSE